MLGQNRFAKLTWVDYALFALLVVLVTVTFLQGSLELARAAPVAAKLPGSSQNHTYKGRGQLQREWDTNNYWAWGTTSGSFVHPIPGVTPFVKVIVQAKMVYRNDGTTCANSLTPAAIATGYGSSGRATTERRSVNLCHNKIYHAIAIHEVGTGSNQLIWNTEEGD